MATKPEVYKLKRPVAGFVMCMTRPVAATKQIEAMIVRSPNTFECEHCMVVPSGRGGFVVEAMVTCPTKKGAGKGFGAKVVVRGTRRRAGFLMDAVGNGPALLDALTVIRSVLCGTLHTHLRGRMGAGFSEFAKAAVLAFERKGGDMPEPYATALRRTFPMLRQNIGVRPRLA
jgi:hypothetical protein